MKPTQTIPSDLRLEATPGYSERAVGGSSRDNENSMTKNRIEQLTSREIEVLQLIAGGRANKQAASDLSISVKTVEKHREHLTRKLGIQGTAGLTHFAIFSGIIQCNPQMTMA